MLTQLFDHNKPNFNASNAIQQHFLYGGASYFKGLHVQHLVNTLCVFAMEMSTAGVEIGPMEDHQRGG